MKIAHLVLSKVYAGIEQHVNELISEQQKTCEVTLICNSEIKNKFDCSNIIVVKNFSRNSPLGLFKLLLLIKKIDIDLVHTHGSKTSEIINSITRFSHIKHVATAHGIKKKTSPFMKANRLIAVSTKIQNSIDRDSIKINNWWSPILPKEVDRKSEYVLAVGRLEKVKGFDLLIESWQNINSDLIIVGSGKEYSSLNKLIINFGLENRVKIIKEVSQKDLIEYYKRASMLVISSRNEGGPRVALEALYLKVPVISTDVGHMNEILPMELLAKPNDLNSLQNLVERFVDNSNYNQSSIYKYISEEFSLGSKASQIMDLYKELLVSE
ncbi:MAG: glycosyltransferase family 4 protein [Gammaproteobacteria bacterium]